MCLCMKWGWCDDVVDWESCVCVWSKNDMMRLLTECHVFVYEVGIMWWSCWVIVMLFVYEVRMMCWCCWVSVMCLCMKWGWCDDDVEWVSCVCVWSEVDLMMLLSDCHVVVYEVRLMWWSCWVSEWHIFVYEVRLMWWSCWVSVVCLCMKRGWFDDVFEWLSCGCVWS